MEKTEFSDRLTCDLLIGVNCRVVVPAWTVFKWQNKFFQQLEAQIASRVIDYCRSNTLNEFIVEKKTGPSGDFFTQVISPLNQTVLMALGVVFDDAWIQDVDPSPEDKAALAALKAREIAELEGEAQKVKALKEGEAEVTKQTKAGDAAIALAERQAKAKIAEETGIGQADLERAKLEKQAAIERGLGTAAELEAQVKAVGPEVVMANLHRQAISDTSISTLVEAGTDPARVALLLQEREKKNPPTTPP